jgi:hypothetical protein
VEEDAPLWGRGETAGSRTALPAPTMRSARRRSRQTHKTRAPSPPPPWPSGPAPWTRCEHPRPPPGAAQKGKEKIKSSVAGEDSVRAHRGGRADRGGRARQGGGGSLHLTLNS